MTSCILHLPGALMIARWHIIILYILLPKLNRGQPKTMIPLLQQCTITTMHVTCMALCETSIC